MCSGKADAHACENHGARVGQRPEARAPLRPSSMKGRFARSQHLLLAACGLWGRAPQILFSLQARLQGPEGPPPALPPTLPTGDQGKG